MSADLSSCGNEECAEGEDRRHPRADEDAVQLVVDCAAIGEEQPHAEYQTRRRSEKGRELEDLRWFHTSGLPDIRHSVWDARTLGSVDTNGKRRVMRTVTSVTAPMAPATVEAQEKSRNIGA